MDHLSMMRALSGRCSLIRMPGTRVGIGRNSPRNSLGASGFGSHVSMWLGPPRIQRMMTELSRRGGRPCRVSWASARRRSGSDSPIVPRSPAFRKLRRSSSRRWRRNSGQPTLSLRLIGPPFAAVLWDPARIGLEFAFCPAESRAALQYVTRGIDGPEATHPVRGAVRPKPEPRLPVHPLADPRPGPGGGPVPADVADAVGDLGTVRPRARLRPLGLRDRPQPRPQPFPQAARTA